MTFHSRKLRLNSTNSRFCFFGFAILCFLIFNLFGFRLSLSSNLEKYPEIIPKVIENPPIELLSQLSSNWDHLIRPHLRFLSSDELEGRGTGTRGEKIAVNYIQNYFESIGLRTYLQTVPLVGLKPLISEAHMKNAFQFESATNTLSLKYLEEFIVSTEEGSGGGGGGRGGDDEREERRRGEKGEEKEGKKIQDLKILQAKLVFVGFGISAPEYHWDDYKHVQVQGKIVVALVGEPSSSSSSSSPSSSRRSNRRGYNVDDDEDDPTFFKGKHLTYYGRWTYKCQQAKDRGALGIILIHSLEATTYPFSVLSNQVEQVHLDQFSTSFLSVRSWITESAAEKLAQLCGQSYQFWKKEASRSSFQPIDLPVSLTVDLQFQVRRFQGQNVVGLLEGTKKPHEYAMISSHHDHLGIGPADSRNDTIYNGAIDNASGCSLLLAAATVLASRPPSRSVIFLSLTAEEYGLLGASYYVRNPVFPISQTLLNINYDVANVFGKTRDIVGLGLEFSRTKEFFTEIAKREGLYVSDDPNPQAGSFYRSDTLEFARAGIPAVYIWNGQDFENRQVNYYAQQRKDYIENRYHQPSDHYEETWNLEGALQQLKVGIRMIWAATNDLSFPLRTHRSH